MSHSLVFHNIMNMAAVPSDSSVDFYTNSPPPGQCAFYLERKKRFCRFRPSKNEKYCAEHAGLLGIDQGKKRIVCPLNPKHTCFEDKLDKHLKKCRYQQKDLPPYHIPGINSGTSEEDFQIKIPWEEISSKQLKEIIQKVNTLYKGYIGSVSKEILHHPCLDEELSNKAYGIPAIRHRKQQASLIGHLQQMNLLKPGLCYVELGAGKGNLSHWIQRAMINEMDVAFILVDRGHVRYKADNQHKWEDNGPKFERLRIDIENLHLGKVENIANGNKPVVATGKHLCGAATDLALRCVTETMKWKEKDTSAEPNCKKQRTGNDKDNVTVAGICIALCCHHRCNWKAYVGKDFMNMCGLSAREFQILCKLSGWTAATWTGWRTRAEMENKSNSPKSEQKNDVDMTGSENTGIINVAGENSKQDVEDKQDDDKAGVDKTAFNEQTEEIEFEDHKTEKPLARADLNLSVQEKEEIGRKCKRLIDFGRVLYMKENGLQCDLKEYIEDKLTPENVAIFAKP